MKNSAFVLLFVALFPSCYRTEIRAGGILDTTGTHSQYANNYVMGLVPATFNVNKCRYGIAHVRSFKPWWSPVVALFTLGIVSPSRIKFECTAAPEPVVVQQTVAAVAK